VKQLLSTPDELFSKAPAGLDRFSGIRREDCQQYARLVIRQLQSRKVDLTFDISAGASVFPLGKRDSSKLREVWDDSRISDAAAIPYKPPNLASPAALLNLECGPRERYVMSKWDGRCLFDLLRVPRKITR